MSENSIKIKALLILGVITLVVFYFFGVLGNFRTTTSNNHNNLFDLAKPTKAFRDGIVPNEYFGSYIYATSPMANLQETVNKNPKINYKWKSFVIYELIPDFVSKRVSKHFKTERETPNQISPYLTASTVYASGYKYLGWLGPVLMFCYLMFLTLLYWFIIKPSNPFYITSMSLLGSLLIFNIFDNMVYFSGVSLQLIYPIIYQISPKMNQNRK